MRDIDEMEGYEYLENLHEVSTSALFGLVAGRCGSSIWIIFDNG